MAAATGQGLPTVEWILKSRPDVNLQAVDLKGRTALWYAGSIGHVQIMQALIKAKAEFNIPDAVSCVDNAWFCSFLWYL